MLRGFATVNYWAADLPMGAKEYQPITNHGDSGFVAASVVDPFGNVLGIMDNPHYVEILRSVTDA